MYSSSSFTIQIARLCIEVSACNDEDSSCLQILKRLFRHHEVSCGEKAVDHRVVIYPFVRFKIPKEASLQWVSTMLGVAGTSKRSLFLRIFAPHCETPRYSGTCNVACYFDNLNKEQYFVPKNSEWWIKHNAEEHATFVFPSGHNDFSEGLPALLMNVIGSQYGCYLLFASCVAINGEALLFTGKSGVGKSTLCMELIKQGATYVGDDLVFVYMSGNKAAVGSLLFPIKCYADGDHTHKKRIDLVSAISQRPPLNLPLKSIYLLQRSESDNDEPRLKPMQSGTMLAKMLGFANKANTNADGRHFVDTISSICSSVPCYYLHYDECNKINLSFFRQ